MDDRVKEVLDCMRHNRLSVCTFLEAFFAGESNSIKISCGMFYKDGRMSRVFQAMLENSQYALRYRQTAQRNQQLYTDFGPYFNTIIKRMLRPEAEAIGNDPLMHMTPADVSPLLCQNFRFQEYECLYLEKAPLLFVLIRLLCCIDDTMPPTHAQNIGESLVSDEKEEELNDYLEVTDEPEVEEDALNHIHDAVASDSEAETAEQIRRQRRKPRPKALMSVMAMSIIMSDQSQRNNGITGRMGIYMHAMKVTKQMHSFLVACGLCNAYDTSSVWLRENAVSDRVVLANKFRMVSMTLCWDNLVHFNKKAEETVLIQGSMVQQNTSVLVLPLHIPPPSQDAPKSEFVTYEKIVDGLKDVGGYGLPRQMLFKAINCDTLTVNPTDMLEVELLKRHIPQMAGDLVFDVLEMLCGSVLNDYKLSDGRKLVWKAAPITPTYVQLDAYQPDFHTCPTIPVDETTIDGTALVVEKLCDYIGTSPSSLAANDRVVLCYVDQLTYKNLKGLKEMCSREAEPE